MEEDGGVDEDDAASGSDRGDDDEADRPPAARKGPPGAAAAAAAKGGPAAPAKPTHDAAPEHAVRAATLFGLPPECSLPWSRTGLGHLAAPKELRNIR